MKALLLKRYLSGVLIILIFVILSVPCPIHVSAAEEEKEEEAEIKGISIKRIHICKKIEEHEPVEIGNSFPADVKLLYCFTDVRDAGEKSLITHKWYHGDELKASVELSVKGDVWRTWSSKWIQPSWTGKWRVDVIDAEGQKIASVEFTVGEEPKKEESDSESQK